ncbi:hypothetical protein [Paenibacillus sp. CF384]|uniref:hypothetical protein n=1 Tax=Paenibacillus sp. CF384 TaxID=1884382 RepID=UPI000B82D7AB|nr:hypothetical protein [Paenibacillus sp. CF384]
MIGNRATVSLLKANQKPIQRNEYPSNDELESASNKVEGDDNRTPGLALAKSDAQSEPESMPVAKYNEELKRWFIDGELATGTFLFVTKRDKSDLGTLYLAKDSEVKGKHDNVKPVGHMGLARRAGAVEENKEVVGYAGNIVFTEGYVARWTNDSGHFTPPGLKQESTQKDKSYWGLPYKAFKDFKTLGDPPDTSLVKPFAEMMQKREEINQVIEEAKEEANHNEKFIAGKAVKKLKGGSLIPESLTQGSAKRLIEFFVEKRALSDEEFAVEGMRKVINKQIIVLKDS